VSSSKAPSLSEPCFLCSLSCLPQRVAGNMEWTIGYENILLRKEEGCPRRADMIQVRTGFKKFHSEL
jgi:hypothetical protein